MYRKDLTKTTIKGTKVVYYAPVISRFTHKQRYAIDVIVEKLNNTLQKQNKLHLVKKLYCKEDVIDWIDQIHEKYSCADYTEAINILNKQLKDVNFDIYKS